MSTTLPADRRQDIAAPPGALAALRLMELYVLVLAIVQVVWLDLHGSNTLVPVGPVNLQAADLLIAAVPVYIALLMICRVRVPALVLFYVALYGFNLGRGLIEFGNGAVTAFRNDVAFTLLMVSGSSGGLRRMGYLTIERVLLVASLAITLLSLSRFVYGPNFLITTAGLDIEILDDWNDGRTIGGPSVIIMAIAFIVTALREFCLGTPRPRLRITPVNLALLAMIAASGQRTASLGTVVVLLLMLTSRFRGLLRAVLALIPVAVFAVVAGLVDLEPTTFEGVGQEMGGRTGTFAFRTQIWRSFVAQAGQWSGFDLAFGRPIGPRDELYVLGRVWTASLHSAYLGLVPLIGFLGGVVFLLGILAYVGRAIFYYLDKHSPPDINSPELRLYSACVFLFYGVSYEWRNLLGFLVGISAAFLGERGRAAGRAAATDSADGSAGTAPVARMPS